MISDASILPVVDSIDEKSVTITKCVVKHIMSCCHAKGARRSILVVTQRSFSPGLIANSKCNSNYAQQCCGERM